MNIAKPSQAIKKLKNQTNNTTKKHQHNSNSFKMFEKTPKQFFTKFKNEKIKNKKRAQNNLKQIKNNF